MRPRLLLPLLFLALLAPGHTPGQQGTGRQVLPVPADVSASKVTATGDTYVRTLADVTARTLGDIINVKDKKYAGGAKGDGVTDDAPSWNAAHNSLPASGGTILVPDGNYLLGSSISISKPVRLLLGAGQITFSGTGQWISIAAGTHGVRVEGVGQRADQAGGVLHGTVVSVGSTGANGIDALGCPGIRIQNLTVIGPGSGTGKGLIVSGHGFLIDNVQVAAFGGDGITIDGTRSESNVGMLLRASSAANAGRGFYAFGANANVISWIETDALFNTGNSYEFANFGNTFVGAHAQASTDVPTFIFTGSSGSRGSIYSEPVAPFAGLAVTFDANSKFNDLHLINGRSVGDAGVGNSWSFGATDFAPPYRRLLGGGTIVGGSFSPATPAGAVQYGSVYQGSGVPNNANGNNGDVYFRTDTPGTANQRIYVKVAGAWSGIL